MKEPKEPRADAVLHNLDKEVQDEIAGLFRREDGTKRTQAEVLGMLSQYGVSVSPSTFSGWLKWYRLDRRMENAKVQAEQMRLRMLTEDPDMDPARVAAVAQAVFTAEMLEQGDVKNYVALENLRLKERQVGMDERRLRMLEAKAARLDALEAKAKELKSGGLSPETLEMLEKQLKLL